MKKQNKDDYTKYARVLPAIMAMILPCISTISFVYHLPGVNQFMAKELNLMWNTLILILPCSLIYGAIGYSSRELFRSISKIIFQYQLFGEDETKMPTTDLLLLSKSPFSESYIKKIRQKVYDDFKIKIRGKINELEERKEIANVVQLIRNVTRNDKILLQYNLQFGFLRNLMGGLVAAIVITISIILLSIVFKTPIILHLILCTVELFALIFSFLILKYRARAYARQLYAVYLTTNIKI